MKTIQYIAFGDADVLRLNEVAKPTCTEDEVLIRIAATTVNPLDMKIRSGKMQQEIPVQLPYTPGLDFAGTIEEAGRNVTRLKAGDQVYGGTIGGTYAQYVALPATQVARLPRNLTLNEAASLAIPVHTAYLFLVEQGKVQAGQRVLIQGAAGSVGQVFVQIANVLGAYVIGTASGEGVELVKSLGANQVIDYKQQDFTQAVKDVDIVIDFVGGETQAKSFETLKKGGLLLSAFMPPDQELANRHGVSARFVDGLPTVQQLEFGTALIEQGKVIPRIVKVRKLEGAATAQQLVSAGGLNGKVVLTVD